MPSDWDQLVAGVDYYWDEAGQRVMLSPPPEQRGKVLDGESVAYGAPPEILARAKAAHFQRPIPLEGRGPRSASSPSKPTRGLWPKRLAEQPPGEASGDDDGL